MTQKEIIQIFKRFLIVFVLCIPLIVVLTLCTTLKSGVVITISIFACGLIFAIEEYIHHIIVKKRKERREKFKKDKK